MEANRVLALSAVGVAILGAALGGYLALPAEMAAPRQAPAVITAHDPNYVAYLKMLASLGPAPARKPAGSHAQAAAWWDVEPRHPRAEPEDRWIEVDEEDDRWEPAPPVRARAPYRPDVVTYYVAPQAEEDLDEPPPRAARSYRAAPWRAERAPPPVYSRGWDSDEPTPPPPPLPSGY
jgi:hypothetical protein